MDFQELFDREFESHEDAARATRDALAAPFSALATASIASLKSGGKVIFFGNGGSAADSQHLAAEFTCRFTSDRAPLAGLALTTDTSALTAIGNDYNFDQIFVRQIKALGRSEDVAIGISTSGNSANVIKGLEVAREIGMTAAGLGGGDGGKMNGLADPFLIVPSKVTARIQEMHILLGHMLCGAIEKELGLV